MLIADIRLMDGSLISWAVMSPVQKYSTQSSDLAYGVTSFRLNFVSLTCESENLQKLYN